MAIFRNTTISGTGQLTLPKNTTFTRPTTTTTIIRWTNTGSQSVSVLNGVTPTVSNTSWTCPTGVTKIEVLAVAGGGGGSNDHGGGGGAGGVVYRTDLAVTPGQSYTVTVGTGGTGGTQTRSDYNGLGKNGTDSVFGITGVNLLPDPTFSSGISGWAPYNASLSWFGSNSLRATASAGNPSGATYTITNCVVGKTYYFRADVTQSGAAGLDARIQISGIGLQRSSGQSTLGGTTTVFDYFTATSTTHILEVLLYNSAVNALLTIDNVGFYNVTDNIVAVGGGRSGSYSNGTPQAGGSGGGAGGGGGSGYPGYRAQGFSGGSATGGGPDYHGGGGGGAGGPGTSVANTSYTGGGGGPGLNFSITGTPTWYGGGGGGCSGYSSAYSANFGGGGIGGGGRGATNGAVAVAGTAGTGGGGGGANRFNFAGNQLAASQGDGGAGGSGVVVIRYLSTGEEVQGTTRFNTDLNGLEIYTGLAQGWVSQDPKKNFAGHNLLTSSNLYANTFAGEAIWTVTNNSTDVLAPDGSSTTTKAVSGTSGNSYFWRYSGAAYTVGKTYTTSFYCRTASGTGTFGVTAYPYNQTAETITATWRRISITHLQTGGTAPYIGVVSPSLSTTFYFWGWQVEEGTSAGPYTRTVDVVSPTPTILDSYRIHRFTTIGTASFVPACTGTVELLVVAGGGSGGGRHAGGGGAGGVIYNAAYPVVADRTYTVTVGAGGSGSAVGSGYGFRGNNGANSVFGPLTAIGGGGGGGYADGASNATALGAYTGAAGGSSGGGSSSAGLTMGTGYPGGYVIWQGNNGSHNHNGAGPWTSGGGGGAGTPGSSGGTAGNATIGGLGGNGLYTDISGSGAFYGGGGGGCGDQNVDLDGGRGGLGGGGRGTGAYNPAQGQPGLANTGGGGGGGRDGPGGAGGSGIVIVRYRYY